MADTIEQIFKATLTAADLTTGKSTVLTTDSNTSFVIKDVLTNNGASVKSAEIEVDTTASYQGFKAASVLESASGSLIIPPSSTVKVKSTDHPVKVRSVNFVTYNDNGSGGRAWRSTQAVKVGSGSYGANIIANSTGNAGSTDASYHADAGGYWWQMEWDRDNGAVFKVYTKALPSSNFAAKDRQGSFPGNWVFDNTHMYYNVGNGHLGRFSYATGNFIADKTTYFDGTAIATYNAQSKLRNYKIGGIDYILQLTDNNKARVIHTGTAKTRHFTVNAANASHASAKMFGSFDPVADRLYLGIVKNNELRMNFVSGVAASLTTGAQENSVDNNVDWGAATMMYTKTTVADQANNFDFDAINEGQTALWNEGTRLFYRRSSSNQKWGSFDMSKATALEAIASKTDADFDIGHTPTAGFTTVVVNEAMTSAEVSAVGASTAAFNINLLATGIKVV